MVQDSQTENITHGVVPSDSSTSSAPVASAQQGGENVNVNESQSNASFADFQENLDFSGGKKPAKKWWPYLLSIIAAIAVVSIIGWFIAPQASANGTYQLTFDGQTIAVEITDNKAHFQVPEEDVELARGIEGVDATLGKPTIKDKVAHYPLSDITIHQNGRDLSISQLIAQETGMSNIPDIVNFDLLMPVDAAKGQFVGTWGLNGSVMMYSLELSATVRDDGTISGGASGNAVELMNYAGIALPSFTASWQQQGSDISIFGDNDIQYTYKVS